MLLYAPPAILTCFLFGIAKSPQADARIVPQSRQQLFPSIACLIPYLPVFLSFCAK
jgi:hypothetical protein